jgi:1-deoxy-D-xylulose-5-phosphate reductoisomerase
MSIPISYILAYPERLELAHLPSLDLVQAGRLEFVAPDVERFPCLALAYQALRARGTAPAVLNAANEVVVEAFLNGAVAYLDIARITGTVLERHTVRAQPSLPELLDADAWARRMAAEVIDSGRARHASAGG